MTPLYVGPSWAVRSYNTSNGDEQWYTSILKETQINALNLASEGSSNRTHLEIIQNTLTFHRRPIIWIYCEPLLDLKYYTGTDYPDLIQREDWLEIRKSINRHILEDIAALNVPIALLGSHSDVVDCEYPNITVIEPSYQKYLCDSAGIQWNCLGWGPEQMHKSILNNGHLRPSFSLIDAIVDTYGVWKKLELHGFFYDVHPTRLGVEKFSQAIRSKLHEWYDKHL
jgi:hypothetical protein